MSEGTPPPPDRSSDSDSGQTPPPPPPPSEPPAGQPGEQPGSQPAGPPAGDQPPGGQPAGWGTPPPPPGQGGGYGAPPPGHGGPGAGVAQPYSAGDAIGYGWKKFWANPAPLLLGTLILLAVSALVSFLANAVATGIFVGETTTVINSDGSIEIGNGGGLIASLLVSMVVSLVVGLLAQLIVAGLIKGALDTVDGRPVSVGGMFQGWDKVKVLVAALIVSVLTAIGTLLCYFPGLVVGFLLSYTIFFVVDRDLEPVEAVKASFSFVTGNLGPTLLFYILAVLVVIAGAILCGVGLLAAVPIAILGAAYTYRRLHGQQVVPA
jgi:uncharacterized membrane protein